jgi:hypothetical protein
MPARNTADWQVRDWERHWELNNGPDGPYVAIGSDVKLDKDTLRSGKKTIYLNDQEEFLAAR